MSASVWGPLRHMAFHTWDKIGSVMGQFCFPLTGKLGKHIREANGPLTESNMACSWSQILLWMAMALGTVREFYFKTL